MKFIDDDVIEVLRRKALEMLTSRECLHRGAEHVDLSITSLSHVKTHACARSDANEGLRSLGQDHRYLDHWINEHTFHWQSQNATMPDSRRGREIIEHEKRGIALHLFVRDHKLAGNKAAPFVYHGRARYKSHAGSAPMSVVFEL